MQEPIDISEKVFIKLKEILKKWSDCASISELLELNEDNNDVQDYLTFLKVKQNFKIGAAENQNIKEEENSLVHVVEMPLKKENDAEELLLQAEDPDQFFPSLEEAEEDHAVIESEINEDIEIENLEYSNLDFEAEDEFDAEVEEHSQMDIITPEIAEDLKVTAIEIEQEADIKAEADFNEIVEVVEEEKEEEEVPGSVFISDEEAGKLKLKHQEEKKIRLSNIKGVKKMETLFEDDFFEEKTLPVEMPQVGNLAKSNVGLDYMEAEKVKPVFKLDLNDRIAFTKKLFSGSQTDLNNAVSRLNEFETLEGAKEYLSEIYYEKNWDQEDEFAQRLWNLVESKFQ